MKFRTAPFAALSLMLLLTGCETPAQRAERAQEERFLLVKRPAMAEKIIEDVVKLPAEKKPTMWEIAQTFPAYDWSINVFHRDGLTEEKEDHFLLKGDRSQTPIEIKQIAEAKPLKVQMAIGPIDDGFGFRKPKLHYTFTRVEGGWKREAWHVSWHGTASSNGEEVPPLSEEENREKIEKITGEPYVNEVEAAAAMTTASL
ncbi:hypothetical protein [Prosthecobacter sp.]|uniref:hypothetical protein n=1 Tax=Prosthecobacter sp. TaxID=1965333 RepID=UPI002486F3DC|nr:hypothetical protein [Prosthecobacter sp.]MDI1312818.1 hypothetical protein [Prosthecobacter sp.]